MVARKNIFTKLIPMFKYDWKQLGAESSDGAKNFKAKYPLIFYPVVLSISFLFMLPIVLLLNYIGFDPNNKFENQGLVIGSIILIALFISWTQKEVPDKSINKNLFGGFVLLFRKMYRNFKNLFSKD